MRSSRNSRKTELVEQDVSTVVVTRKRKARSPAESTKTSSNAASSTRASGSPLEEIFEEGPPSKRQALIPPSEDPEGDRTPENNAAASNDQQLTLPTVEQMLPDHLFERLLAERQPSPPPPGTDPSLFLTSGSPSGSGRVPSLDNTPGLTPPTRLHSPLMSEPVDVAHKAPSESSRKAAANPISPHARGGHLSHPQCDERVIGVHVNEAVVPPLPHDYPPVAHPMYWHPPPPGADMWGRPPERSPSPGRRHAFEPQAPEPPAHGPKTRKAWTNFEREVIREYCLWLLKIPEYEGEAVLPPDPEIWEDIKDALWDMYPGRFQRSRQGIMELARKMNLRRGTREELSKRQTRPKDQLLKNQSTHTMKTRESASSNACGENAVSESR